MIDAKKICVISVGIQPPILLLLSMSLSSAGKLRAEDSVELIYQEVIINRDGHELTVPSAFDISIYIGYRTL